MAKEVTKVTGYETVINNKNIGNVSITNSHTPKPGSPGNDPSKQIIVFLN